MTGTIVSRKPAYAVSISGRTARRTVENAPLGAPTEDQREVHAHVHQRRLELGPEQARDPGRLQAHRRMVRGAHQEREDHRRRGAQGHEHRDHRAPAERQDHRDRRPVRRVQGVHRRIRARRREGPRRGGRDGEDLADAQRHRDPAVGGALGAQARERAFREEHGRLTAALVRSLGDWDLAEELVQDALVAALEHWPRDGIPENPGAWLMTTARRKGIDRLRREARYRDKLAQLQEEPVATTSGRGDDRLELIFACCHPALPRESQIALTLRSVVGLTTAEIARAFVTPEATIAQRLVRAKRKIADAGIPLRVPEAGELPDRLGEILAALYLMFTEASVASGSAARRDLADGATWVARLVADLPPDAPAA